MNEPFSSPCSMTESDLFPAGKTTGAQRNLMLNIKASNTILYCRHWAQCVHFYQHILGFRVTFAKDDWFRELEVSAGSHISIADVQRCTIASSNGVGVTLSWQVEELTGLREHLLAANVKVTAITSSSWRAPYFYAYDPEGHRIEFWQ